MFHGAIVQMSTKPIFWCQGLQTLCLMRGQTIAHASTDAAFTAHWIVVLLVPLSPDVP